MIDLSSKVPPQAPNAVPMLFNILRWAHLRTCSVVLFLLHGLGLLVAPFLLPNPALIVLLITGVFAHGYALFYAHTSVTLNVAQLRRMQVEYEKIRQAQNKNARGQSGSGMALH